MIFHCEMKTKNINSFLYKDQLLSEAATTSYSGEICRCPQIYGPSLRTIPLKEFIY